MSTSLASFEKQRKACTTETEPTLKTRGKKKTEKNNKWVLFHVLCLKKEGLVFPFALHLLVLSLHQLYICSPRILVLEKKHARDTTTVSFCTLFLFFSDVRGYLLLSRGSVMFVVLVHVILWLETLVVGLILLCCSSLFTSCSHLPLFILIGIRRCKTSKESENEKGKKVSQSCLFQQNMHRHPDSLF